MPNTWPKSQPQPQQHKHKHNRTTAATVNDITPRTDALFRLGLQWPVFMSKVFNGSNLLPHMLMDQWRSQCFMVVFLCCVRWNLWFTTCRSSNEKVPMCFAQRMPSDDMKAPLPPGWQAVARCFQLSKSFLRMWVNVGGLGTAACCQLKNFAADPRAFHCIRCKEPSLQWFFHGNMSRLYVKLGGVLHDAN